MKSLFKKDNAKKPTAEPFELKPCPFCGGEANCNNMGLVDHEDKPLWWVVCLDCKVSTHGDTTKEAAIAAWNRRPEPKAIIPNKRISGIGKCPTCKQELCMDDESLHYCPTCETRLITPGKGENDDADAVWNRRADGWISVDERLPEDGSGSPDVLVAIKYRNDLPEKSPIICCGYMIDGEWWTYREHSCGAVGRDVYKGDKVTHWKPLPEPPKGDRQ